jgi:hypothetical protein
VSGPGRVARRAWEALALLALWRVGALRRRGSAGAPCEPDPAQRRVGAPASAERLALCLLALAALAAVGFVALFIAHPDTQLLGLCLGASLALLAGALAIAGRHLVPQETQVEKRPRFGDGAALAEVHTEARAGLEGITRRRLLGGAAGLAGGWSRSGRASMSSCGKPPGALDGDWSMRKAA